MLEQTVLQAFIGPFKIESQRQCLSHAFVLQCLAAEVEHDPGWCGRRTIRQLFRDHVAIACFREIVPRRPLLGVAFATERVLTRFKRLESRRVVAKVLDPDGVEVVATDVERQILAPVVRVALVNDPAVHIDAVDHVRS